MRFETLDTTPRGSTMPLWPSNGSERWRPKLYQKKALKFVLERGAAGLLLDPGLGKTSITLAALSILLQEKLIRGALVIAPLRPVHLVWPEELRKWTDFHHLDFEVLHGGDKNAALKRKAHIYLMNPEGLRWLFKALGNDSNRWPFDTLIIDESSKFKNTRTLRFKSLKDYLPKFARRYILTGTPSPNGLLDLFGQIYCLDLGHALGRYITHYRVSYFAPTGYGGYTWVPQPGAEKKIYEAVAPLVLRMDEKDYLQLPELVNANHYVQLPKKAREVYDKLERDFVVELLDGHINVRSLGTATIKLRQIANGAVYPDGTETLRPRPFSVLHDEKLEFTVDLLEELQGQPTLIAYEFDHDRLRLAAVLKKAGYGAVPDFRDVAKAKDIQARWDAGELPVLLGHPQSVAYGLNLQSGSAVIWFAMTWDLELYIQFIKRVHRQGQLRRVFVHHVLARDTYDEAMLASVRRKDRTQRALLDALRTYYRKQK